MPKRDQKSRKRSRTGSRGPNGIKNPGNDPERVVGAPNGIKNPGNDPGRVVVGLNWIKNPGNDPERVVRCPNGIKNPGNDPGRVVGAPNGIKNPENNPRSEVVRQRTIKKRPKPQIYRSEATKPLARGEGFGERVRGSSPANNKKSGLSRFFYCSSGWPLP